MSFTIINHFVTGGLFVLVGDLQVTVSGCFWMIKCNGHGDYYFLIHLAPFSILD